MKFYKAVSIQWQTKASYEVLLEFTENWVHLLVGIKPKHVTKPKIGRRKDLLLAASKENTGDLSQSSVFPNIKTGKVLS